jgi:hypothetical protein
MISDLHLNEVVGDPSLHHHAWATVFAGELQTDDIRYLTLNPINHQIFLDDVMMMEATDDLLATNPELFGWSEL